MTRALWQAAAEFPLRQFEVELTYRDPRGHSTGFRRLCNTHHRLLELLCTWAERRSGRHCHYSMAQIAAMLGVNLRWAKRVVRDLEATGLIVVHRGVGRGVANEYFVHQELVRKPTLVFGENGGRIRVEMVAGIQTTVLARQTTISSEKGGAPVDHPTPDVNVDVRRARARARDGMRIASPAGSARADFLSSRASLGPRNGGSADGERDPRLVGAVLRCPRCREVLGDPYEHDCAAVYEAPPRESEQVAPPPVLPDHEQLLHEHMQRLERERANHQLEVSR